MAGFNQYCCLSSLAFVLVSCGSGSSQAIDEVIDESEAVQPNILFIVADDQGLDASAQFSLSNDLPNTPIINSLASNGIVFENAWATPSCTTSRGTLISGLHGINSGIETTPSLMDTELLTLQRLLKMNDEIPDYVSAVVGKWHLASPGAINDPELLTHPNDSGVDYYAGNIAGNLDDYFNWPLTINGNTNNSSTYHTTAVTDLAIDWVEAQSEPWFMWLAYAAPHAPFHLPPSNLHTRDLSGDAADIAANPRAYYLAAIEAMDTEIGRLLDSIPADEIDNTFIVYLGDNGTPRAVLDASVFPVSHGKNSLYEGGVRVPMIASGAGVTRSNERESALVNSVDLYATVADLAGIPITESVDSISFNDLLSDAAAAGRRFNYSEFVDEAATGWAVRSDTLKLIEYADGTRELYDMTSDLREELNLISQELQFSNQITEMENFVAQLRSTDGLTPTESATDITGAILTNQTANCADYIGSSRSSVTDVFNSAVFDGNLRIEVDGASCIFSSNAIPNHDFNDGTRTFANDVSEQVNVYTIPSSPELAVTPTALSLTRDNAILLNGVKVDILAAACFGVSDEKTGCNDIDQPWRFDPMFAANGFSVDTHNAHTQPNGDYHYHGLPNALFLNDNSTVSPVVGFAADGFPIYGSSIQGDSGIRKVLSSYQLKSGSRPSGPGEPGGFYNGSYRDDYEYVSGLGDLDECNGMSVNGSYRYHMTEAFPHVLGCFRGTPDDSFLKRN